ncbi:hypothetical protein HEK616_61680 [Streptomyces nigrescens]|uniref:PPE family domain-containing protein n=1 Tax=Streptomyces nigrescens TaxID=1920 RepID=A0ABN6R5L3_STRNI|nr:hypothetical protein [Streptomyces nigrescens]BDM72681.1 hypothetical protein HEK616_61680 [Streptomyces nigrescens]
MVDAKQEYDSAKAMEQQRKNHEREERLKSFKGQRLTPRSPSDFHHHGINALRAMIEHASPEAIETSGHHWRASADRLGGEDGRGGIRKAFMDAVDHASAHWEGSAAQAFRREAGKVLEKIDRTYQLSRNVESTLIGSRMSGPEVGVAHNLREAKKAMSKIHDPGVVDRATDESGDDSQFKRDMANPKMDTRMALELNRDNLSLSKERQVEAVIVMDELAANYDGHGGILREDTDPAGPTGDWPKQPSTHTPPPPVRMPITGGTHPHQSATPKMPNGAGGGAVPEGFDSPKISRPELPVTTGLDSVQGGTIAPPTGGGTFSGGTTGGSHGVTGGTGGFPGGAVPPGVIGMPGGMGGSRGAGGAGGMRGGMPGAGAAGKAGGVKGAAGRSGPQARTRGGLVGKPGGPAGGAKQGGSGLHRSRGGKQAGMMGAAGAKGKGKEKERTTGQRPDYLVEDEETWNPQRNVAPRVIE